MKTLTISMAVLAFWSTGVASADAADVSGAWKVTGDFDHNPIDLVCTLKQTGGKIVDNCGQTAPADGNLAYEGTVNGTTVEWDYDAGQILFQFKGTLESPTAITGTLDTGFASGHFTATKQ